MIRDTSFGIPGQAAPSDGHGVPEILELIKTLEAANVPCCVVGVQALRYYGAFRMRNDWELCVPTDMVQKTSAILVAEPCNNIYEPYLPPRPYMHSLLHTFPRFKFKGLSLLFNIIPSEDCHFICEPSNFEWSQMGIPYPKMDVFAQSLLETHDLVALTDLIDGMDLTEEWGAAHLDLNKTSDLSWAQKKNEKIRASIPVTLGSVFMEVDEGPFNLKDDWEHIVRSKERRIGAELPKELYVTKYRYRGEPDPRFANRKDV